MICWENTADVFIQLNNGDLYVLKHQWAWKLTSNENILQNKDNVKRSTDIWTDLPNDIELAFTIPISEQAKISSGRTIFLKTPMFYTYNSYDFLYNSSIVHWDASMFSDNRFIITFHNASVVLVAKVGNIPDGIKGMVGGMAFMFDDEMFPERLGVFEILAKFEGEIPWLNLKQLIPLIHFNYTYLALFDLALLGNYYCFIVIRSNKFGFCNMKPLYKSFQCNEQLLFLKENNWLEALWQSTGLSLDRLILVCIGALAGSLWINLFIMLHTIETFYVFYKKLS